MMSFLLPIGLLALLTLPIILLLHLLRQRVRRVAVPSLLHWLQVPRRDERMRRRLPITLLLLLHLLAAALIALALGYPQIQGAQLAVARQYAIILDTSTSMAAQNLGQSRFDLARARARDLLSSMGAADQAILISAGATAQVIASGGSADLPGLIAMLEAVQPGGESSSIPEALTLAESLLDPRFNRRITVITDGVLPQLPALATNVPLDWEQLGGETPNQAITTFAIRPWSRNVQVYARINNYSGNLFSSEVQLFADDQLLSTDPVRIAPNSSAELVWTVPNTYRTLRAALRSNDGLPQDNAAFLNMTRGRPITALLVSDAPDALQRALAAIPNVQTRVVTPDAYNGAPDADLVVFDRFVPTAWPDVGGLLLIDPPGSPLLPITGEERNVGRSALVQRGTLLSGLSFSGVDFGRVRLIAPPPWAEVQLARQDASDDLPLILSGRTEGRKISVWMFDLRNSDLPSRLAFPILTARTVRDLTPAALPESVRLGAPLILRPGPRADQVRIMAPDGTSAVFPAAPSLTIDQLSQVGLYQVDELRGGQVLSSGRFGVNAGSALESNLQLNQTPLIDSPLNDAAGMTSARTVTDLWPWLALAVLSVLLLEWAYVLLPRQRSAAS